MDIGGLLANVAKVAAASKTIETIAKTGKAVRAPKPLGYDPAKMMVQYPDTGPPVKKFYADSGLWKDSKQLTPEALAVQKASNAADKEIKAGNWTPYYDASQRYAIDPAPYLANRTGDTARDALPKTQAKLDEWVQLFDNPEARARLDAAYRGREKDPDAQNWYMMGQLYDDFVGAYGKDVGAQRYKAIFADPTAATTGGANPTDNFLMGAYGAYMKNKGLPIPKNTWAMPYPVGGRYAGGNMKLFDQVSSGKKTLNAVDQPKRYDYQGGLLGDMRGGPIDEQIMSIVDPRYNAPPGDSYGVIEGMLRDSAKNVGTTPANHQGVAWADATGKDGKSMIQHFNESVWRTHRIGGKSQADIVRDYMAGIQPMYAVPIGGVGMLAAMRAGDGSEEDPNANSTY